MSNQETSNDTNETTSISQLSISEPISTKSLTEVSLQKDSSINLTSKNSPITKTNQHQNSVNLDLSFSNPNTNFANNLNTPVW